MHICFISGYETFISHTHTPTHSPTNTHTLLEWQLVLRAAQGSYCAGLLGRTVTPPWQQASNLPECHWARQAISSYNSLFPWRGWSHCAEDDKENNNISTLESKYSVRQKERFTDVGENYLKLCMHSTAFIHSGEVSGRFRVRYPTFTVYLKASLSVDVYLRSI